MSTEAATVEVRRHLSAKPEAVFAAFADAGMVGRWLTPSPEIKLTVLSFDFRVGGGYRFAYRIPSGLVMTVNGIYSAIERPSKVVFSWNIEPPDEHAGLRSEVTVTIAAHGSGSELRIQHAQLTRAGAAERHRAGWQGALDHLAAILAKTGAS